MWTHGNSNSSTSTITTSTWNNIYHVSPRPFHYSCSVIEAENDDLDLAFSLQLEEALQLSTLEHHTVPYAEDESSSTTIVTESVQPSGSLALCEVCLENLHPSLFCSVGDCPHSYCSQCLAHHILSKVDSKLTPIFCPDSTCAAEISFSTAQSILPPHRLLKLSQLLAERVILQQDKIYCPVRSCSALMLMPEGGEGGEEEGGVRGPTQGSITRGRAMQCVECGGMLCTRCKVVWHEGLTCEQYEQLPDDLRDADDVKLLALANLKQWMRCGMCRAMVERNQGCNHMICRCGHQFCYSCGTGFTGGFCANCNRKSREARRERRARRRAAWKRWVRSWTGAVRPSEEENRA